MQNMWFFVLSFLFVTACADCSRIFGHSQILNKRIKRDADTINLDYKLFGQILDHFNPSDVEPTWKQRYLVNDDYYDRNQGSAVFLELSGELTMNEMRGGSLNYAKEFGALCFKLEHRYYGGSRPTSDLSLENLRYLSSHQALADIAYFIMKMNELYSLSTDTKWIVFGGSYAGSLAAWSRLKYPHLIYAAVASSPIVAPQPEFTGYFERVENVIWNYDRSCSESIHNAVIQLEEIVNLAGGLTILKEKFRVCSPLNLTDTREKSNIANTFSFDIPEVIQAEDVNSSGKRPALDVVCRIMKDQSINEPIDRYAYLNFLLHHDQMCQDVSYQSMIKLMSKPNNFLSQRQWLWQTCTEIGLFLTSSREDSLFGSLINHQYFLDTCTDALGDYFDKERLYRATEKNQMMFGGTNFKGTRVIFVTGGNDPWNEAGHVETNDPSIFLINIEGTSHCSDLEPEKEDDPVPLKEARKQIEGILADWLV